MGGGLSKRKRVADYSPEFDVPIVYENVVHLQRLMDSYMPPAAVPAVVKAHITASRRSSKRRSSPREHAESVERLSPPKKEHSAASANRISQITEVARRSTMLVCEDAEPWPPRSPGDASHAFERPLSLGTDVVLSPLRGNLSLEKAVAVLGDEATGAAIVSTDWTRRSYSSDGSTSGSFNSTRVTTALDGCRSSADTALAVLGDEAITAATIAGSCAGSRPASRCSSACASARGAD